MADDLSPSDRASLAAERGPVNMSVGAALVFDGGPGVSRNAVAHRLTERLHLIPRYRQRLKDPAPLGLANPVWVDDERFDIDRHVRTAILPEPGGDAEIAEWVAREMSSRLDRSRPLWELWVVEGLRDGRVALVPKMHHALVDGVATLDVGTVLLDPTEEPVAIAAPAGAWQPRPSDRASLAARLAATPFLRAQRVVLETANRALETSPRSAAEDLRRATELVSQLARTRPQAPMTPLNQPISPDRSFALARGDLAALKAAGKSAGGTVNDALLAVVCGMMARYLRAVSLDVEPVALVPVSVRRADEESDLGNRISTVFVDLPTGETDPLARLRALSATMAELKDSAAVRAGAIVVGATGWAPPAVSDVLVRAMGGIRAFNLVVSNLPGPQQPFFLGGSRLREMFPVVPLNPGNQGLTVGILSYDGGVFFGLLADRDLDPPVDALAAMLQDAQAELLAAAGAD